MVSPSFTILERIRGGMTQNGLDMLITDPNTSLEIWQDALKGYNRYVKLIKLWTTKKKR